MDAAAVSVRTLGVPRTRGLLLDWWALDSPVKVVRWLLGHTAPLEKEESLSTCRVQEGRWPVRVQARWRKGTGNHTVERLISVSPLTCPSHIWVSRVAFPQNSNAVLQLFRPQALDLTPPSLPY